MLYIWNYYEYDWQPRLTAWPSLVQLELRAEIDQGAPAEFAEAAMRSVVARLTEAPTNLHQCTPGLPGSRPLAINFACNRLKTTSPPYPRCAN